MIFRPFFRFFSFPFAKPKLNFRVEWSVVVRFSIFGTKEKQFLVCAGETTKSFLNQLILESPVEHRKRVKAPLEGADAFDSKIKLQSDYSLTDWKTFQKSPLSTSHCNFLRSFGSSENLGKSVPKSGKRTQPEFRFTYSRSSTRTLSHIGQRTNGSLYVRHGRAE